MEKADILKLLKRPWQELAPKAEATLLKRKGGHVFVRGLIEFSNICRRNCLYCGLRKQNKGLIRYCLSQAEILEAAREACAAGVDTIVLQSGEGSCQAQWLADVIKAIVSELHLPVTLSVGERARADYELWRRAGASRYLIKHETADPALYARLHPGHSLQERVDCLLLLRELGYEIGSGFMIGLPWQSLDILAEDILLLRRLRVGMAGAGPFLAQGQTPLASFASGTPELALRVLAVLRLALPEANLPATTALATADPISGQKNGLLAGANVLMPSFTPGAQAGNYRIYDHKNRVSVTNAARAIAEAGRQCQLWPNALQGCPDRSQPLGRLF